MKLGDLVREYIIETGSMKQMYQRYYALGVSGLRELQMDYSGVPQIATITINSAGVAQLPTNYIRWNRVCIVDGFGVLHALAENNDINLKLKNTIHETFKNNFKDINSKKIDGMNKIQENLQP